MSAAIDKINSFVRAHIGEKIAIFLHSSLVLESTENIKKLKNGGLFSFLANVYYYIPENCYYELKLLAKCSYNDLIKKKANFLLETFAKASDSLQTMCVQKDDLAAKYNYNRALFVFYEPAAAEEFSEKFGFKTNHHIFSYNPYNPKGYNFIESTGTEIFRTCSPLINTRRAETPNFNSLTIKYDDKKKTILNFNELEEYNDNGGEAIIYTSSKLPGQCIKLYRKIIPGKYMEKKLENLRDCHLAKNAAFPTGLVYDGDKCVGFIMDKLEGKPLSNALWQPQYDVVWEKYKLLANMLVSILELRINQMVITDLSMRNLYVCPDGRVVVIDTDSMEVAHYPGGGVTPTFAHPDVTEEYYFTRLRKAEHTNFPLAVLLFNILVGEDPLACCGHIDNLEWRKDRFPLSNDSNGGGCELNGMKVNEERLREWNLLSKDERECFINAFNFTEICDIGTWVKAMPLLFSGFRFLPKPADKDLDYLLSMYEI